MVNIFHFDSCSINQATEFIIKLVLIAALEIVMLEVFNASYFVESDCPSLIKSYQHFTAASTLQKPNRRQLSITEFNQFSRIYSITFIWLISFFIDSRLFILRIFKPKFFPTCQWRFRSVFFDQFLHVSIDLFTSSTTLSNG